MICISSFDTSREFPPDVRSLVLDASNEQTQDPHPSNVEIYYLKEPVSAIREGSSTECWVDDNYGGARVIENAADMGEPIPSPYFPNTLRLTVLFVVSAYQSSTTLCLEIWSNANFPERKGQVYFCSSFPRSEKCPPKAVRHIHTYLCPSSSAITWLVAELIRLDGLTVYNNQPVELWPYHWDHNINT